MADPFGTIRTDEYRRTIPVYPSGEELTRYEEKYRNPSKPYDWLGSKATPGRRWVFDQKSVDDLLNEHPKMRELAKQMMLARLSLYDTEEEGEGDKSVGWIQKATDKTEPVSSYFTPAYSEKQQRYWGDPNEAGLALKMSNPEMFEELRKIYEEQFTDFKTNPTEYAIRKGKREEAGENESWYRTIDEMSDAVLAGIGEQYTDALQKLLQRSLMDEMKQDLASEEPKHLNAMKRKLLPNFNYESGNPTYEDFLREQQRKDYGKGRRPFEHEEFRRPSWVETAIGNVATPAVSSVYFDPELYYKTGKGEIGARLASDAMVNTVPFFTIPRAASAAARFGARFAPYALKAMAQRGGAFAGGATAGLGQYLLERGENTAFDAITGKGTNDMPITGTDAAMAALFGGLSGPMFQNYRTTKQGVKTFMDTHNPKTVTRSDLKDMQTVIKETGEAKKQLAGRADKKSLKNRYLDLPYRRYRDKFPNEVMMIEYPKPAGSMSKEEYFSDPRFSFRVTDDNGTMIPFWTDESKDALWKAAQSKDPSIQALFTGETDILDPQEVRKQMNKYGGIKAKDIDNPQKNSGLESIFREAWSNFGTGIPHFEFVPPTAKQIRMNEKARISSKRRRQQKIPSQQQQESIINNSKLGYKMPLQMLGGAIHNVVPWSNIIQGTEPYTYEAFPKKENE